jgi:hypothetical protein
MHTDKKKETHCSQPGNLGASLRNLCVFVEKGIFKKVLFF